MVRRDWRHTHTPPTNRLSQVLWFVNLSRGRSTRVILERCSIDQTGVRRAPGPDFTI